MEGYPSLVRGRFAKPRLTFGHTGSNPVPSAHNWRVDRAAMCQFRKLRLSFGLKGSNPLLSAARVVIVNG